MPRPFFCGSWASRESALSLSLFALLHDAATQARATGAHFILCRDLHRADALSPPRYAWDHCSLQMPHHSHPRWAREPHSTTRGGVGGALPSCALLNDEPGERSVLGRASMPTPAAATMPSPPLLTAFMRVGPALPLGAIRRLRSPPAAKDVRWLLRSTYSNSGSDGVSGAIAGGVAPGVPRAGGGGKAGPGVCGAAASAVEKPSPRGGGTGGFSTDGGGRGAGKRAAGMSGLKAAIVLSSSAEDTERSTTPWSVSAGWSSFCSAGVRVGAYGGDETGACTRARCGPTKFSLLRHTFHPRHRTLWPAHAAHAEADAKKEAVIFDDLCVRHGGGTRRDGRRDHARESTAAAGPATSNTATALHGVSRRCVKVYSMSGAQSQRVDLHKGREVEKAVFRFF